MDHVTGTVLAIRVRTSSVPQLHRHLLVLPDRDTVTVSSLVGGRLVDDPGCGRPGSPGDGDEVRDERVRRQARPGEGDRHPWGVGDESVAYRGGAVEPSGGGRGEPDPAPGCDHLHPLVDVAHPHDCGRTGAGLPQVERRRPGYNVDHHGLVRQSRQTHPAAWAGRGPGCHRSSAVVPDKTLITTVSSDRSASSTSSRAANGWSAGRATTRGSSASTRGASRGSSGSPGKNPTWVRPSARPATGSS